MDKETISRRINAIAKAEFDRRFALVNQHIIDAKKSQENGDILSALELFIKAMDILVFLRKSTIFFFNIIVTV